jgi:iron complex outermembrane receptor protein
MLMKRLVAGAATTVIALSIGVVAHAQSTAGQTQEVIVTGARQARSTGGLAVQVNEAKDEAIVTKQFIETQVPSSNLAQLINFVPGVSYSTEDPGGLNSGDLRIHGFDGNHIAVILDGQPLNDTGNYAVFPGEYVIGEQVERITVNIGSSDVDSPSASALGATINITTKNPPTTAGVSEKLTGGSYGFGRTYTEIDSGVIGPWGTTAYLGAEYAREDNFAHRPGDDRRWNINGKIYQPLSGTDFMSLSGVFTSERQTPAFRLSQAQITQFGRFYDGDNYTWAPETITPGKVDAVPNFNATTLQGATVAQADSNYWSLFPNPVDFGLLHGSSRFTLGKGLTFTFDPSFFYTLANGGGGTTLRENDPRLIGNNPLVPAANSRACVVGGRVTGVDLNGDGDCLDTVVAYGPSNTQTYRYGLTSSLLYDYNEQNHFLLSYTLDLGRHRQTGEFTYVDPATGKPDSVFGGKMGFGPQIITADGTTLQGRDRNSLAILNQLSADYIGKFMDDKLHVSLGIRAPYFERDLDQHCDTVNGTTQECDSIDPAKLQAAFNADLAAHRAPGATATALTALFTPPANGAAGGPSTSALVTIVTGNGGVPNFRFPFKQTFNFHQLLPNAGLSYRPMDNHLFYVGYAKGFSAPKTDDLYTSETELVQPETSDNFSAGYRYQTRNLNVSFNLYDTEYKNRIVQSIDPNDPTTSIDRNVGDVRVDGIDLELGWSPMDHLHFYGSANFNQSELKSNILTATTISGTVFQVSLPTQGKELVLTPDTEYAGRVTYDIGPLKFGFEGKYLGSRFISDVNDAKIPAYAIFNMDARLTLPYLNHQAYIQFNAQNMFNRQYISRSTTFNTLNNIAIPNTTFSFFGSTPSLSVGAPTTVYLTIGAKF